MSAIGNRADLHMHSTASDGTETPANIVSLAKRAGLQAVAVTDHDTVAGIEEAMRAGERLQVQVVPGVEISTAKNGKDIHVLGYFIDYRSEPFLVRLEQLRKVREKRNSLIIDKLRQLGFQITMEDILESRNRALPAHESIGRPHIAEVLVRKGYVHSVRQAFDLYLGKSGKAYVNLPRILPEEAIAWIHDAGGAAVLAHPGLYKDDEMVRQLISAGLDGIEVYHSDHTRQDEQKYKEMAERYHLIGTGGSDFHGERNGAAFHGPIGARTVDCLVIRQLQEKGK